jgi:hypothetical protein
MNKNLTYHDKYLDSYYSPFPREKSNKEVLKYSSAKKLKNNKILIDIPPSVTASYMQKNPFYFDLKKHTARISQSHRPKTSNQKLSKSVRNFHNKNKNKRNTNKNNVNLNPENNYCYVFEKAELEKIFNNDENKYICPKNKLSKGCEIMKGLIYKPMSPRPQLTPDEALKIINKINFPEVDKYRNKKTPNYLNEFRLRQFIEKEYERLVEDEKGYPHGTFKVWEEDRLLILTNLFLLREELLDKLRQFPVNYYLRSVGINNRRREVEKKLDEIDYAIKIFQLTEVYLRV